MGLLAPCVERTQVVWLSDFRFNFGLDQVIRFRLLSSSFSARFTQQQGYGVSPDRRICLVEHRRFVWYVIINRRRLAIVRFVEAGPTFCFHFYQVNDDCVDERGTVLLVARHVNDLVILARFLQCPIGRQRIVVVALRHPGLVTILSGYLFNVYTRTNIGRCKGHVRVRERYTHVVVVITFIVRPSFNYCGRSVFVLRVTRFHFKVPDRIRRLVFENNFNGVVATGRKLREARDVVARYDVQLSTVR